MQKNDNYTAVMTEDCLVWVCYTLPFCSYLDIIFADFVACMFSLFLLTNCSDIVDRPNKQECSPSLSNRHIPTYCTSDYTCRCKDIIHLCSPQVLQGVISKQRF